MVRKIDERQGFAWAFRTGDIAGMVKALVRRGKQDEVDAAFARAGLPPIAMRNWQGALSSLVRMFKSPKNPSEMFGDEEIDGAIARITKRIDKDALRQELMALESVDERTLHRYKRRSYGGGHSFGRREFRGTIDPRRSQRAKRGAKKFTKAQRSKAMKNVWRKRGASGRKAFGAFMSKLKRGKLTASQDDLARDVGNEVIARWDDGKRKNPVPIEPVVETGRAPLSLAYQGLLGNRSKKSWVKFVAEARVARVSDRRVIAESVARNDDTRFADAVISILVDPDDAWRNIR